MNSPVANAFAATREVDRNITKEVLDLILEIVGEEVREWAVSRIEDKHILLGRYTAGQLRAAIADRAKEWTPESLLRAQDRERAA